MIGLQKCQHWQIFWATLYDMLGFSSRISKKYLINTNLVHILCKSKKKHCWLDRKVVKNPLKKSCNVKHWACRVVPLGSCGRPFHHHFEAELTTVLSKILSILLWNKIKDEKHNGKRSLLSKSFNFFPYCCSLNVSKLLITSGYFILVKV